MSDGAAMGGNVEASARARPDQAAPAASLSIPAGGSPCQGCGACCAYSAEWPRFTLEDDGDVARLPAAVVDEKNWRMRCEGDRCAALAGEIGVATACTVYENRPLVCRDCQPGDDACTLARVARGMEPLAFVSDAPMA